MSPGAFLLVLSAAFTHAGWNFAARKVSGNMVIMWLSVWCAGLFLSPPAIYVVLSSGLEESMSSTGWQNSIASGVIHALYSILLALAYQHGEISVVYPIARGSGIGLTALLGWSLLEETLSIFGSIGIVLVFAGILFLGIPAYKQSKAFQKISLSLSVGCTIVAYSLVDKVGVNHADPIPYLCIAFLISASCMGPYVWKNHHGSILRTAKLYYPYILVIGIGAGGTYLIILYAFTMGQVAYVVAVREFAVVIGALLGIIFLKEQLTVAKSLAIIAITLGLICIKSG
ncbi:MAG: EamA family transporter [SAR324 cluster bacterium]|nr:EamA family transporter [SAR324 cluster bacterium]